MTSRPEPADLLRPGSEVPDTLPIWTVRKDSEADDLAALPETARAWLKATHFKAAHAKVVLVPGAAGALAGVVLGLGDADERRRKPLAAGALPGAVPAGTYRFAGKLEQATLAATAWALGAYRFERYKSLGPEEPRRLAVPEDADRVDAVRMAEALYLARDLINTPASDLGPEDLADAAESLAKRHGARFRRVSGEQLLAQNFPMIHAVGRASTRPPCLADLTWSKPGGRPNAPRVTLIGKGICFDSGGLDIKPASAMLLMKKDMGGAATALAAAHMIMDAGLDVRLRVLVAAAENSISGNAFRPGDVLDSRAGIKVEIGNTDAEGRLVLGDALALADEEAPDALFTFATLTGAARTALGPELPAMFATDDAMAARLQAVGLEIGDPCWRMPFWANYDAMLSSDIADVNHVSDGPFAGAVTAALFLKRFVKKARSYTHLDMYAWVQSARPGQPKGGEAQMARAVYETVRRHYVA